MAGWASTSVAQTEQPASELTPLNESGAAGNVEVSLEGNFLRVDLLADNLLPGAPHAQHIHFEPGTPASCPSSEHDADGDGVLTTTEGKSAYGPIQVSLTTEGDFGAESSALALDRFPVADDDGMVEYGRTFELSPDLASQLAGMTVAVVQHGVNLNDSGEYDGEQMSELDPSLPLEGTVPADCVMVTVAAAEEEPTTSTTAPPPPPTDSDTGAAPSGGMETGAGGTAAPQDGIAIQTVVALGALGGLAIAGGTALAWRRRDRSR